MVIENIFKEKYLSSKFKDFPLKSVVMNLSYYFINHSFELKLGWWRTYGLPPYILFQVEKMFHKAFPLNATILFFRKEFEIVSVVVIF